MSTDLITEIQAQPREFAVKLETMRSALEAVTAQLAAVTAERDAARAELAAGRALPLAWLWLLAGAELTVTNPQERGHTLKLKVEDAKPQGQ